MSRPRQPPSEFLAQAFTRRGSPDDLPYSGNAVWTIRQHALDAVQVALLLNLVNIPSVHAHTVLQSRCFVGLPLTHLEGAKVYTHRWEDCATAPR